MKNLDLATYGVEEMNEVQMQGVDGGGTAGPGASYWTEHESFMDGLDYIIGFFGGFFGF